MLEDHKHKHPTHNFDGITENRVNAPPVYFSVLFYGLIIWGIIFCAYYLLSGWSSEAEFREKMAAHAGTPDQQQTTATPPAAEPADAEALFAANCAGCHGADATGGFGSDLTAADYQYGKSAAEIRQSIVSGRGTAMPGFAEQLSAAEIDALVDFLLQL
jgi:cytochrome c oxidase cbb3-type subunit 3